MRNQLKIVWIVVTFLRLLRGNPLVTTNDSNPCEDWISYEDEKCLKLLDTDDPKTQDDAEYACKSLPRNQSRLVTVKSREEQDFLEQFLNDNESVWLGLKENPTTQQFEWNDGSKLEFSNLVTSNIPGLQDQCVEMNKTGQWRAVSCNKKNMAVCESDPRWALSALPNLKPIANQTELVLKINQSEKDWEDQILTSELKTDLLKEATDKTMTLLKEANERIAGIEQSEESTGGIAYPQRKKRGSFVVLPQQVLCGDWTAYKAEKCIKTASKTSHQTMKDAEAVCQAFSPELNRDSAPNLITINSKEEQEFLQKFLFVENGIVDNVWLGLSRKGINGSFEWNDGSELSFSNWASQSIPDDQHDCVQMESGDGAVGAGLWLRVSCKRKNTVVCEKKPTWTVETLRYALLNFKLEEDMKQNEWEAKFEKSEVDRAMKQKEWEDKFEKSEEEHVTKQKEWEDKFDKSEYLDELRQRNWEQKFDKSEKEQTVKQKKWEQKLDKSEQEQVMNRKEWEQKFQKFKAEHAMKLTEWEQKFMKSEEEHVTKQKEWKRKFEQFEEEQTRKQREWRQLFEKHEDAGATKQREWTHTFEKSAEEQGKKHRDWAQKIVALEQRDEALAHKLRTEMQVPLGFIYVQLPSQPSPLILWPNYSWTDVSANHAGLFFRVVGGNAAPFGQVQDASCSHLEAVNRGHGTFANDITVSSSGSWSQYVDSGGASGYHSHGLRFRSSRGETRPRNQAVKIWKRMK